MIKNRSFLMGLGIGIIVGTLILQLALIGQGAVSSGGDKALSRSELEAQAETLNLKVYDANQEVMTEEEWTSLKMEPDGSQKEGSKTDEVSASPKKPATPKNEEPVEPKQPTTKKTSKPDEADTVVRYRVIPGATLNDVADHLTSLHVIQDRDAFTKEANRQKVNTKIQTGTYEFVQNESVSSVIQKITSPH
ncbi:hypothetical protein [Paenibacillus sp. Marseille-Q4541]|uniref:hypothetical protein n=1 Tax=Paenibacillus sp. Marseille-Q4541 TaxID=2831522 RepID=UPI001BA6EAEC|nr:hypothetical protein [Paenibacillus sp. Marseille-Q4541]